MCSSTSAGIVPRKTPIRDHSVCHIPVMTGDAATEAISGAIGRIRAIVLIAMRETRPRTESRPETLESLPEMPPQ